MMVLLAESSTAKSWPLSLGCEQEEEAEGSVVIYFLRQAD